MSYKSPLKGQTKRKKHSIPLRPEQYPLRPEQYPWGPVEYP